MTDRGRESDDDSDDGSVSLMGNEEATRRWEIREEAAHDAYELSQRDPGDEDRPINRSHGLPLAFEVVYKKTRATPAEVALRNAEAEKKRKDKAALRKQKEESAA
jgi:hypothetical protein